MTNQSENNQELSDIADKLLQLYEQKPREESFLIGITGSSSAGKTTLSHDLKKALQMIKPERLITVIQADNFIYSNTYLETHDLMHRKGFPETFDYQALKKCLLAIQERASLPVWTPCYSQEIKDIIPNKTIPVDKSDIYILEGVNLFFGYDDFHASDYIDFSIYLDTNKQIIKERALKRFFDAYEKAKITRAPYFEKFTNWTYEAIFAHAEKLWEDMDMTLLKYHIEPYKTLANLVLSSYT